MASFQLAANPILGREPGSKETRASWRKQAAKQDQKHQGPEDDAQRDDEGGHLGVGPTGTES